MFAKMPKSIRIGHIDVSLEVLDETPNNDWGRCEHSRQRILIRKDHPSKPMAVETVFHEISHMICALYRGHHKKVSEEKFITITSAGWAQVIRDNPKLIKWIGDI